MRFRSWGIASAVEGGLLRGREIVVVVGAARGGGLHFVGVVVQAGVVRRLKLGIVGHPFVVIDGAVGPVGLSRIGRALSGRLVGVGGLVDDGAGQDIRRRHRRGPQPYVSLVSGRAVVTFC